MSLPPAEVEYQLAHADDDRRSAVIVGLAVCLASAYIAVILRFVSRKISHAGLKTDDYLILVGLFFSTASAADSFLGIHFGLGRHFIFADPVSFAKNSIASETLYSPAIASVKLSILFLYRRIFPSRGFRVALYIVGGIIFSWMLACIFGAVFQCVPIQAMWDPTISGKCIDVAAFLTATGALNIVTDAILLALPVPQLWHLNTSITQKAQLIGIFLTGGLVCIISIVRVSSLTKVTIMDGTWTDTDPVIWTIAEVCVAVISACLPTLRPLFSSKKRTMNNTSYAKSYAKSGVSRSYKEVGSESHPNNTPDGDAVPLKDLQAEWSKTVDYYGKNDVRRH